MNVLEKSKILYREIAALLGASSSFYLYGSVTMDDYRPGWSDIDFLCLAPSQISEETAKALVNLRQTLQERYRDEVYRSFEGVITWEDAFWDAAPCTTVYWGTSGQRIRSEYSLDCFSRYALLSSGILLFGKDRRNRWKLPDYKELKSAVNSHYHSIRLHAAQTGESLYSCGWLLDIARCLYTLRTGKVTAKTAAGEWALENELCPSPEVMEKVLEIRRNPAIFREDSQCRRWCGTLNPEIQKFADVLERELKLSE